VIIAGTGHRPDKLGGYGEATFLRLCHVASEALIRLKPTRVISGMALGWDQALAQAATEWHIPFVAAVPFKGQEAAWPAASQKYYHELLRKAESVVYVSKPPYAARKMQVRNEFMVHKCDLLLALWDGSDGGTANCVRYAKLVAHKRFENVWEQWVAQTDKDRLASHH